MFNRQSEAISMPPTAKKNRREFELDDARGALCGKAPTMTPLLAPRTQIY
jgi:hypothetical protein